MRNVRLFVDFWNLQLRWNENMPPRSAAEKFVPLNWRKLPIVLMPALSAILSSSEQSTYKGTRVFASVNSRKGSPDEGLKTFLHTLGQSPGFDVSLRERRPIKETCPSCGRSVERTFQKGVSTGIITALFEGAINNSYDVALLASSDADLAPAIRMIQDHLNKEIVHVGFDDTGTELRKATWGHILVKGGLAESLIET